MFGLGRGDGDVQALDPRSFPGPTREAMRRGRRIGFGIDRRGGVARRRRFDRSFGRRGHVAGRGRLGFFAAGEQRSEENTSQLLSLMRTSYAVFSLLQTKPTVPNTLQAPPAPGHTTTTHTTHPP